MKGVSKVKHKRLSLNVETDPDIELAMRKIIAEYERARKKFDPINSTHEGYAVIQEELDEMWDDIKANNITSAKLECIQVAAMCLAFILET